MESFQVKTDEEVGRMKTVARTLAQKKLDKTERKARK
jgi:hypothetical protein